MNFIETSYFKLKNYLQGVFLKSNNKQLSEVNKLREKLQELFKMGDEGFVVTLNGKWGIGKTFFWKNFVEKNLNDKKTAYVSLFGKENLKDIEQKIIFEISSKDKFISEIKDKIKNVKTTFGLKDDDSSFGITGSVLNIGLSLFEKKDFKDVIVCFDDFERMSNKLELKDIFGLISELKEQKNCKIVMIYNQDEVEKNNDLSKYKDKIIDYELHYKPTVAESYDTISDKLKVFKNYPLKYLESKGINNIRVMQRLINALNDFEFIEKELKGYADIESEIVSKIMQLSVINAQNNNFNLDELIKYSKEKFNYMFIEKTNDNSKINKDYEEILFLLDDDYILAMNGEILTNINYYIVNSIVDKSSLITIINNKKKIKSREEISEKIKNIYYKFRYDLKYSDKDYVEEMFSLFQAYKDFDLVKIEGQSSFIYYINEMIRINPNREEEYKEFAIKKLKEYIDGDEIKKYDKTNFIKEDKYKELISFDESLSDYIEEREKKLISLKVKTVDDVIKLIQDPRKNGGWSNEPDILNSIDKDTYKKYIQESPTFFEEVIHFIKWVQGFNNSSSFDNIANKFVEVFKELRNNPDCESKINKVLEYLNINDNA